MLFVENPSLDPYFNIAAEEYLMRHFEKEITMIWRSNASVIVGKHQNTLAEINLPYVVKQNIPVVRRLSGGGTVFHDPGNINFTFIKKADKKKLVDFKQHTEPVINFLNTLMVPARFEGKNDLRVHGLKISGNAEHVHKNKVLHHGTLLFESDLNKLNKAIKAREERFESKAIKSVRSKVANISGFLEEKIPCEVFEKNLKDHLMSFSPEAEIYNFNHTDLIAIEKLKTEKYTTWEWNFGYSPTYRFKNHQRVNGRYIQVEMTVEKGFVTSATIMDSEDAREGAILSDMLKGALHNPGSVEALLVEINYAGYNQLADRWEVLGLFF